MKVDSNIASPPETINSLDKRLRSRRAFRKTWMLHSMLVPAVLLALVFNYLPLPGIVVAFMNYKPWLGFFNSTWIAWDNFKLMFELKDIHQVIGNTLLIACLKIILGQIVPIVFALLLNEVRQAFIKKTVQTLVYLPHFLSWIILGGILLDILSLEGIMNQFLSLFGAEPIMFLGDGAWFRTVVVVSDIWKEFGFSTIIFLATLAGINPSLYEAAEIDGAGRWKQTVYVTLPSMLPIIIVTFTLSLGNVLNANFDQIYNLINPLVTEHGDIIDTYVFRTFQEGNYSFAAAVGLFKSVISFILITFSYWAAYRFANYRIF
jgi:putative aldouronate transport system permease protein